MSLDWIAYYMMQNLKKCLLLVSHPHWSPERDLWHGEHSNDWISVPSGAKSKSYFQKVFTSLRHPVHKHTRGGSYRGGHTRKRDSFLVPHEQIPWWIEHRESHKQRPGRQRRRLEPPREHPSLSLFFGSHSRGRREMIVHISYSFFIPSVMTSTSIRK